MRRARAARRAHGVHAPQLRIRGPATLRARRSRLHDEPVPDATCYRERIGLRSVGIDSPHRMGRCRSAGGPAAVRHVRQPIARSKGSMLFARLADMLGSQAARTFRCSSSSRPQRAGALNAIPGLDFKKYPHIMAAPATPRPADFFALTRILLVPSVVRGAVWTGGCGSHDQRHSAARQRSRRRCRRPCGAGGPSCRCRPGSRRKATEIPSEEEVRPWFDAVCRLWDDPAQLRGERPSGPGRRPRNTSPKA